MEYRENEGVTGFRDVTQRAHYSGFYIHRERERERERRIYIYIYIEWLFPKIGGPQYRALQQRPGCIDSAHAALRSW